jgi:hypothetical protein
MNGTEVRELRARLRGELITPSHAAYAAARKVAALSDRGSPGDH